MSETKVSPADHERCIAQLQKTLDHFKAGRDVMQSEKEEIWKMLASGITLYELCHAISGMRFEPPTTTYQPAKNISIFRLWNTEQRLKMLSRSTQEQQRRADKAAGK